MSVFLYSISYVIFVVFRHATNKLFILTIKGGVVGIVALLVRLSGRKSVVYQKLRVKYSLFVYVVHKTNV